MTDRLDEIEAGRLAHIVEEALFPPPFWRKARYSKHDGYNAFRRLMKNRAGIMDDRDHQRDRRHMNAAKVLSRNAIIETISDEVHRTYQMIRALMVREMDPQIYELIQAMARRDPNLDPVWMEQWATKYLEDLDA